MILLLFLKLPIKIEYRMIENFDIFNFKLMDENIKLLSNLDTGKGKSMSGMYKTFYEPF